MEIKHLELTEANKLVEELHRHHKPVRGHRFSIGALDDNGKLIGAAIIGRPVARAVDSSTTLEVTRLVTDGTANACSFLYAASARAGKALGYKFIQTYILKEETGVSLKASGWTFDGVTTHDEKSSWGDSRKDGLVRRTDQPQGIKQRWKKELK